MEQVDERLQDQPDNSQPKNPASHLAVYQFKKGQSGNPAGRTPGKSLKERAKAMLNTMTEEEEQDFLNGLDKRVIWEMAEGKPETKTDITSGGKPIPIYGGQSLNIPGHNSNQEDLPA